MNGCFVLVCAANGLHSQLFLKGYREMESSGPHTANQSLFFILPFSPSSHKYDIGHVEFSLHSYDWFRHRGQEVMNHLPFTSDFHPFGPFKKHRVMKQFPANSNTEKPVSFCLQTLDTNLFCLVLQWGKQ
jgi:hypothetical protein